MPDLDRVVSYRPSLFILFTLLLMLSSCGSEKNGEGERPIDRGLPVPSASWSTKLTVTECVPDQFRISYIPGMGRIVTLYTGKGDSSGLVFYYDQGNALIDTLQLNAPLDPGYVQMALTSTGVFIADKNKAYMIGFSPESLGKARQLNVPDNISLISLTPEGVTGANLDKTTPSNYYYAPPKAKLYWEDFAINAPLLSVKRNSQGRWAIGTYSDMLLVDGDTIFPKPREKQMAFLAFKGNYQGNDWVRQLGGIVPGKPRDWRSTYPLDLQMDPAGYGWVLWQGELTNPAINGTILGVNFYDPNGILMKNLIFQAPGRELVSRSLQLMKDGNLCIHSSYTPENLKRHYQGEDEVPQDGLLPVQSVLIFDRQGTVSIDTSFILKKGQEVFHATIDAGDLKLTGLQLQQENDNATALGCIIFHDTYKLN